MRCLGCAAVPAWASSESDQLGRRLHVRQDLVNQLYGMQPELTGPLDLLARWVVARASRAEGFGEEDLLRIGGQALGLGPSGKEELVECHGAPRITGASANLNAQGASARGTKGADQGCP